MKHLFDLPVMALGQDVYSLCKRARIVHDGSSPVKTGRVCKFCLKAKEKLKRTSGDIDI